MYMMMTDLSFTEMFSLSFILVKGLEGSEGRDYVRDLDVDRRIIVK
jgi:hypothetical protein